jgi:NTP pyrophosphatase (non-canonical NTP hydrolase)
MDFNEYQTKSRKTAGYPDIGHPVIYPTLGLANEAGEVAGKIKKVFRDKSGQFSEETRQALQAELGDVLWYLAQVATELDLSLDEIAEYNLAKLYDRLERGKIKGDGDNR